MLPTCIVIGCINSIHNQTVKYYKVPAENTNICRQWYINTLREDLEPSNNHYICIEHFDEESFLQQQNHHQHHQKQFNKNNQILKEDAVPSLFEIEVFQKMIQHQELVSNGNRSISNSIDLQAINDSISLNNNNNHHQQQTLLENLLINDHQPKHQQQRHKNQPRCSFKTCININNHDTILYSLPKIAEIAKKWMIACQIHDNDLKLCREHFLPSDFNEYNYLKPDAIPSVFINNNRNKQQQQLSNNNLDLDTSSSIAKRARMDPEQRAELLSRIPKAVKRTTIQSPIINHTNQTNANNNANLNANKIQKAMKHTNSILSKPDVNTNSKFLSAALNSSQTISPVKASIVTVNKQTLNQNNNNKAQKAVKHTSTASLLKDILPPPIMQSTKRTPRAVKHTNNVLQNSNSSILITAPATAPLLNHKIVKPTTINNNNNINIPLVASNSSIVITTQSSNSSIIINENNNNVGSGNITQKTTYVYKKITQQPEIELYLECEDDDLSDQLVVALQQQKHQQQQVINDENLNLNIKPTKQISVSIDKTKLNNSLSTSPPNNNINNKFQKTNNSPLNAKPIGSIINTTNQKLTSRQQLQKLGTLPVEKRYIQVLLKYYSRVDDCNRQVVETMKKGVTYPAKCNLCEKYLANNIDFISHICAHLEGDNYVSPFEAVCTTCSVCERNFKNPFDLIIHLDSEHLNELNEYKCRICERQHKNLNELLAHLNTLHTINEMPYRCDVCSFRTSFYADAIYHIKMLHKDTLHHFCPYCLKSILLPYGDKVQHVIVNNFYSHLITHFNKHENNELIESKCKHCRKCILHVRFTKEHLNNDHNNNLIISTQSPVVTNGVDVDEGLKKKKF
jgi:hypothetical protein